MEDKYSDEHGSVGGDSSSEAALDLPDSFFALLSQHEQVRTLFVSGLPMDAKPRELYLLFRAYKGFEHGLLKIMGKNIVTDKANNCGYDGSLLKITNKNGKNTSPVGFVTFSSRMAAENAKQDLQGVRFDPDLPQTLRLEFAKSNTKVTKPKQSSPQPTPAHPAATIIHPITGQELGPAFFPAGAPEAWAPPPAATLAQFAELAPAPPPPGALPHHPAILPHHPATLAQMPLRFDGRNFISFNVQDPAALAANTPAGLPIDARNLIQFHQDPALLAAGNPHPGLTAIPMRVNPLFAPPPARSNVQQATLIGPPPTPVAATVPASIASGPGLATQVPTSIHTSVGSVNAASNCSTLFVANLGQFSSEQELKDLFSSFAGFVRLRMHNKGGSPVAFVEFQDMRQANEAMSRLQGFVLLSSDRGGIRIEYAKNKMGEVYYLPPQYPGGKEFPIVQSPVSMAAVF